MVRIINIEMAKLTKLVNLRLVSFLGIDIGRVKIKAKIQAQVTFPVELLPRNSGILSSPRKTSNVYGVSSLNRTTYPTRNPMFAHRLHILVNLSPFVP